MSEEITVWVVGGATTLGVILGTLLAVGQVLKPFKARLTKWVTTWEQFMDDWAGEPARDGRDAVPGVMERLNNIDGELRRNGGKSMKDAVTRIEKRLIDGDKRFDKLEDRVFALEDRLK